MQPIRDDASFLKESFVPQTLDAVVKAVLAERPVGVDAVITCMVKTLNTVRPELCAENMTRFLRQLEKLESGDAVSDDTEIYFSVPTLAGGVDEIFPGSSNVLVSAQNCKRYCDAVRFHLQATGKTVPLDILPMAPRMHITGNYAPILELIKNFNSDAEGAYTNVTDEDLRKLLITWSVPFRGVVHDVEPHNNATFVTLETKSEYCAAALKKLLLLEEAHVRRVTKEAKTTVPGPLHSGLFVVENDHTTKQLFTPNRFEKGLFSPFNTVDSVDAKATRAGGLVTQLPEVINSHNRSYHPLNANLSKPTAIEFPVMLEELRKINTPDGDQFTAEEFSELDVYWMVPLGGKLVDLVENGRNKKVTLAEKNEFVRLAHKKLGITTPLNTPKEGRESSPKPRLNLKLKVEATPKNNKNPNKSGVGLFSPTHFEHNLFSPYVSQEEFTSRYEETTQGRGDGQEVDKEFAQMIDFLQRGDFTDEDIQYMEIYFCAPLSDGRCIELIPNGFQTQVTADRKSEFIQLARTSMKTVAPPVNFQDIHQHSQRGMPVPRKEDESKTKQLFSPSHFQMDLFAPYTSSREIAPGDVHNQMPPALGGGKGPNTPPNYRPSPPADQETMFWNIINQLEAVNRPGGVPLTEEELADFNLTFCVELHNGSTVELVENGRNVPVDLTTLKDYVRLIRQKESLIHDASATRKHITAKTTCQADSNSMSINSMSNPPDPNFLLLLDRIDKINTPEGEQFEEDEFDRMGIRFCVPLVDGSKIDLVPNGRDIPVTLTNRQRYVQLVHDVTQKKVKKLRKTPTPLVGTKNTSSGNIDIGAGLLSPSSDSRSRSPLPQQGSFHQGNQSHGQPPSVSAQPAGKKVSPHSAKPVTTDAQVQESIARLRALPDMTEEEWISNQPFRFCLRYNNELVPLVPNGEKEFVSFDQRVEFVNLAVSKLEELQQHARMMAAAEASFSVASQSQSQSRQVVDPVGAFSPTHHQHDLFAPAQPITVNKNSRSNNAAGGLDQSRSGRSNDSRPQSELQEFLAKHQLEDLGPTLSAEGVTSLNDLRILTEADYTDLIKKAVPRRRLITAVFGPQTRPHSHSPQTTPQHFPSP